jgi:hypothetical protein
MQHMPLSSCRGVLPCPKIYSKPFSIMFEDLRIVASKQTWLRAYASAKRGTYAARSSDLARHINCINQLDAYCSSMALIFWPERLRNASRSGNEQILDHGFPRLATGFSASTSVQKDCSRKLSKRVVTPRSPSFSSLRICNLFT